MTPTRELLSLIGLLRVKRDFQRAETVIGWLSDVELQQKLRKELVFQQGDWREILRRGKLDSEAPDFISVNSLQEALLFHLSGDQAGVQEVEQRLRTELEEAIKNADASKEEAKPAAEEDKEEETVPKAEGKVPEAVANADSAQVKLLKTQLRALGAITLDWPLVVEFLQPDNLANNFTLLVVQNRVAEAFEVNSRLNQISKADGRGWKPR